MRELLSSLLNSLTAKYVAVFVLLVAVPAIGISWYLLDSSYNDNKQALIKRSGPRRRRSQGGSTRRSRMFSTGSARCTGRG